MSNDVKVALVIGGAGFIGRVFCKRLISMGYYTFCVDNVSSVTSLSPEEWPDNVNCKEYNRFIYIEEDCRDFFQKENARFDLVIYLATTQSDKIFDIAQSISIDGAFFTWISALNTKPKKVVYFSSHDVETNVVKYTGETLAKAIHQRYGIDIVCFRPFKLSMGFDDDDVNYVVKRVFETINSIHNGSFVEIDK